MNAMEEIDLQNRELRSWSSRTELEEWNLRKESSRQQIAGKKPSNSGLKREDGQVEPLMAKFVTENGR